MSQYIEIERRFFVDPTKLPSFHPYRYVTIQQGYLSVDPPVVRVRIETDARTNQKRAFMTTKGRGRIKRTEVNIRVGLPVAEALMTMARRQLSKQRWNVSDGTGGKVWHVDKFLGRLEPLWLAEIELQDEDEDFLRPAWIGSEVTDDPNYSNVNLATPSLEWMEQFQGLDSSKKP